MQGLEAARKLSMGIFSSMPVYLDNHLGIKTKRIQVKFPRSKKRRIRNKFTKDDRNFRIKTWQEPVGYQGPGFFVVNDEMMKQIRSKTQA